MHIGELKIGDLTTAFKALVTETIDSASAGNIESGQALLDTLFERISDADQPGGGGPPRLVEETLTNM